MLIKGPQLQYKQFNTNTSTAKLFIKTSVEVNKNDKDLYNKN